MLSRVYKCLSKVTLVMLFASLLGIPAVTAQVAAKPAAQITAINATTQVVTARDLASGRTFEFRLQNAALLRTLRAGQGVYANFARKQVSLDGRTVAGQIIETSAAVSSSPAGSTAPRTASPPSMPLRPATLQPAIAPRTTGEAGTQPSPGGPSILAEPTVGSVVGQPKITLLKKQDNLELRHLSANVDGQQVESDIMRLTGPEAIQSAYDQGLLPESAKDALLEHAKNLDPSEPPIYIVNKQIAEAWAKTHTPLPKTTTAPATQGSPRGAKRGGRLVYASFVPDPEPQNLGHALKHAGGEISKDAKHAEKEASKDAEHAGGQVSDAYKHATGQTTKWWRHWQSEATKDFEKVEDCWVDHRLSVRRHVNPGIPTIGYTADLASLNLGQGTVRFDMPIALDMEAEASVFYIPCMAVVSGSVPLPFFIRPRDVSVQNGHLSAAASITANVQKIAFNGSREFFTPPAIKLLPETLITVGPIPVTLEAYLYLRGGIRYTGSADVESSFTASTKKEGPFSFTCNGHGCTHDFSKLQASSQISNNPTVRAKVAGRVNLEPYLWTAVQVGVYEGMLMGRAGPEIALSGDVWAHEGSGCGVAAGASGSDNASALTADIDANISAAWQVWALGLTDPSTGDYFKGIKGIKDGKEVSKGKTALLAKHLYFADLIGSTALMPLISPSGSPVVAQPAAYNVRMRPCYPYDDQIQYRVQWTAANDKTTSTASTSTGQAITAAVWGMPQKDLVVNHTWAQPGDYTLSITPMIDKHGRNFPARASQLAVHVGGQASTHAQTPTQTPVSPVSAALQHK